MTALCTIARFAAVFANHGNAVALSLATTIRLARVRHRLVAGLLSGVLVPLSLVVGLRCGNRRWLCVRLRTLLRSRGVQATRVNGGTAPAWTIGVNLVRAIAAIGTVGIHDHHPTIRLCSTRAGQTWWRTVKVNRCSLARAPTSFTLFRLSLEFELSGSVLLALVFHGGIGGIWHGFDFHWRRTNRVTDGLLDPISTRHAHGWHLWSAKAGLCGLQQRGVRVCDGFGGEGASVRAFRSQALSAERVFSVRRNGVSAVPRSAVSGQTDTWSHCLTLGSCAGHRNRGHEARHVSKRAHQSAFGRAPVLGEKRKCVVKKRYAVKYKCRRLVNSESCVKSCKSHGWRERSTNNETRSLAAAAGDRQQPAALSPSHDERTKRIDRVNRTKQAETLTMHNVYANRDLVQ